MKSIALYHKSYNQKHLTEVKTEMETLGTPTIKAIWSECYGLWLAIEGCHRIRAAKELGLNVIIEDVSNDETALVQVDGEEIEMTIADLESELTDNASNTIIVNFEDNEEDY